MMMIWNLQKWINHSDGHGPIHFSSMSCPMLTMPSCPCNNAWESEMPSLHCICPEISKWANDWQLWKAHLPMLLENSCLVPFVKNLYILGNFQMGKCPMCPCPVPTNFEWENCLCPSTFLPCPGPTLINQIVFGREFCCGFRHALKIKTCKWGAVWIEKL